MASYTLKTQIKHLKKELKEIEEQYLHLREFNVESLKRHKESKMELEEFEEKFFQLYEELENLHLIENGFYMKKSKILDQINKKIWFFKKNSNDIEYPESLEKKHNHAYRKYYGKKREIDDLQKKYPKFIIQTTSDGYSYSNIIYTSSISSSYSENVQKYKNYFQNEKNRIEVKITYFENKHVEDFEKDEEYLKKKRKLKVLTARLEKRNKEKTLANAYLKKSRNDSSSVKSNLKNHETCPYCGTESKHLEADHIYPISLGGLSVKENMIYVCKDCNRKKGGATLREFIKKFDLNKDYVEENLEKLGKKF